MTDLFRAAGLSLAALYCFSTLGCGAPSDLGEDGAGDEPFYWGEGVALQAAPPASEGTLAPDTTQAGDVGTKSCATGRSDTGATITLGGGFFASGTTFNQCAQFCPAGSWVYGIQLRAQPQQGNRDDKALTTVALHCNDPATGAFVSWITSQFDTTGEWWGSPVTCPSTATPMTKARLKHLAPVSGDDVGATRVRAWCSDGTSLLPETAAGTDWGSWLNSKSCPSGQAVCGINVGNGAFDGSDLIAVDEVDLKCCNL